MEDRGPEVLAVNVLFFILSWLAVGLRVFVRATMRRIFGKDDWLMVATQIAFTAYLSCQLGGVRYGTGRHLSDLTSESAEHALHFWWFCEVFYVISACLLKISVAVFLLRITVRPIHVWILRLLMAGTIIFGLFYLLLAFLQCKPISQWWTLNRQGCISGQIVVDATYCASTLNAVADWTFGLLPIFIVRDLQMSKRMKVMVAGVLGFAALGSTATVIRIPYVNTLGNTQDFLWVTTDFAIWTTVEVGIGIVAACAVTLRPLLRAIMGKSQGTSQGTSHENPRAAAIRNHRSVDQERRKYQGSISLDSVPLYKPQDTKSSVIAIHGSIDKSDDDEVNSNAGIIRTVSTTVTEIKAARLQSRNMREVAP